MSEKPTARDVARQVGTSTAAVSRAFRRDAPISKELRERIHRAASELGYLPPGERSLAAMTTGIVTLVAGDLSNPFYPMTADALSQALLARGRRMILHPVPPASDVDLVMRQVLDFRSDAAIVTSATMPSRLARECRRQKMPVVLFNRVQSDAGMTAVTCDNYGGGRLVAQRLVAMGRRRVAMIGGRRDTSTHLERARGFGDALGDAGMSLLASAPGNYQYDVALGAAEALLSRRPVPDAIFCVNDIMALATLDAARARGVAVPDDVAVIGFDDIPMANWASYRLTTVRQPVGRMVAEALDLIDLQLADPGAEGAIRILPVTLIERESG